MTTFIVEAGDCAVQMALMPESSIDAIVCDPPYGLEFMGKEWDSFGGDVRQRGDEDFTEGDRRHGLVRHGVGGSYGGDSAKSMRAFQVWCEQWGTQAMRVLKPGGHLLAFGGTRTYHRLTSGLEDAGFEIRDCIAWMYGSGFPKSMDLSKAFDRAAGADREVIGKRTDGRYAYAHSEEAKKALGGVVASESDTGFSGEMGVITAPATPEAQQWEGWGTALKPAFEPVVVARKPMGRTLVSNVAEHGTGALNIDASRLGMSDEDRENFAKGRAAWAKHTEDRDNEGRVAYGKYAPPPVEGAAPGGRWPANVMLGHHDDCERIGTKRVKSGSGYIAPHHTAHVPSGNGITMGKMNPSMGKSIVDADGTEVLEQWDCHPECPVAILDAQSGVTGSTGTAAGAGAYDGQGIYGAPGKGLGDKQAVGFGDKGGASRFFYSAKASSAERNAGLAEFEAKAREGDSAWIPKCSACDKHLRNVERAERTPCCDAPVKWDTPTPSKNFHPTVKPIDVMRWLIRLVTPPGGTVMDPFCGSGTTGVAAILEGFDFVGIERDPDYLPIARTRMEWWAKHPTILPVEKALAAEAKRQKIAASGQTSLL